MGTLGDVNSRARTASVLGLVGTVVAGAFGGALYVAFTFAGASAPTQPTQVTVHQAAATAQPTATVTVTKAVTRKTTVKVRTLVNAPQGPQAAADPAPRTADPEPANGSGHDSTPPPMTLTIPGRGGPTTP